VALKRERNKFYIDEGCFVSEMRNGSSYPLHTHDFLEIVYIFSGRSIHTIDGIQYPAGTGDALFINYGSTHSFEANGKMHYANILIKPEFISESLKGVENAFALLELDSFKAFAKMVNQNDRILHFSAAERRQIESLLLLVHAEQDSDRPGKELMLHSLFNTLLTLVFRKMALPMKTELAIGAELLRYIRENCAAPLTLEEIAAENHYNPAYFSRLFKKQTGYNFTEYVSACRVELACKLLQETELKIGDIAAEVGFSDRTKFFRVFAEHTGTTPLKFRKSKI